MLARAVSLSALPRIESSLDALCYPGPPLQQWPLCARPYMHSMETWDLSPRRFVSTMSGWSIRQVKSDV
jgi:hypothetical protein